jgi:hypothetical protein
VRRPSTRRNPPNPLTPARPAPGCRRRRRGSAD